MLFNKHHDMAGWARRREDKWSQSLEQSERAEIRCRAERLFNLFNPAHVFAKNFRNLNSTFLSLIILHDGNRGSTKSQSRSIVHVDKLCSTGSFYFNPETPCLIIGHEVCGVSFTIAILSWHPRFYIYLSGIRSSHIACANCHNLIGYI